MRADEETTLASGAAVFRIAVIVVALGLVAPWHADDLDRLDWMSGSWVLCKGETRFEEHWTTPAAGLLLGVNRTVTGDRLRGYESIRIEARDDGLTMVASPAGQATHAFALRAIGERFVEFHDPEHDFPKRIRYERRGDTLVGRVSGEASGDAWDSSWEWRRVASIDAACP